MAAAGAAERVFGYAQAAVHWLRAIELCDAVPGTITTREGTLVLHEAGLQCPQPGTGPQVKAVWAADSAASTGIFRGARGQGSDTAYPARNTAAPHGTLTLSP